MDIYVIWIDTSDDTKGAEHQATHPHHLHLYSEADECDHLFRVADHTQLGHVFDEFFRRTSTAHSELDRFKCGSTGEDLLPLREATIAHLKTAGHCQELQWVFSNRPIHITINGRKKEARQKVLSFTEVVSLRYDGNPPQGGNWVFTVDYRRGPHANREGCLTVGHSVHIKDGMIFDVTATDKS